MLNLKISRFRLVCNVIFVTLCDFFVSCTHSHTIHAFLNLLYTPPTLFTHLLHHPQLPWHQSHIHSHFNLKTLHLLDCIYKTHTLFLAVFSFWWSSNWAKRRNYLPFLSHQSCQSYVRFEEFFVSRAFERFGTKRSTSGAFGFDDVLEVSLKTPLNLSPGIFFCKLRTRHE